jgi:ABC-type glutathione transport system ATPase component
MEPLGGGYLYDACPTEVVAHFQCKKTKVVIGRTYCRKSVPCSYPTARSAMICTRVGKAHEDSGMLKLNDLYKIYRTDEVETVALNGVNFEVDQGDFVAVMGPSGCGKSTLLNIVGLLDSVTENARAA